MGLRGSYPADRQSRQFSQREIKGVSFWVAQTFANPIRTLKELKDITGFRIKKQLETLIDLGIPIYLFLQKDDKVVPASTTLKEAADILPSDAIKVVPGGHNDLFFQPWQRDEFCRFIHQIRELTSTEV